MRFVQYKCPFQLRHSRSRRGEVLKRRQTSVDGNVAGAAEARRAQSGGSARRTNEG